MRYKVKHNVDIALTILTMLAITEKCWQFDGNFDDKVDNNIDRMLLTECWHNVGCPRDASASKNISTFEFVELNIWLHKGKYGSTSKLL